MTNQTLFFTLLASAFALSYVPVARAPFAWLETYFHEFSHGLAAILTFGKIHSIKLNFNGSGCCTTSGGWRFFILNAGYMGAVSWGAAIYIAGGILNEQQANLTFFILLWLLAISTLFWVRSISTLIIMLAMASIFALPIVRPDITGLNFFLQFIGLYIVLSAIKAPLYLIDGKHEGDGADLADITVIFPEGVWITLWFGYALAVLYWLWSVSI